MTLRESLRALLAEQDPWQGTPQELWEWLTMIGLPAGNPSALGKAINSHRGALAQEGLFVGQPEFVGGKYDKRKVLTISRRREILPISPDLQGGDQEILPISPDLQGGDQEILPISPDLQGGDQEILFGSDPSKSIEHNVSKIPDNPMGRFVWGLDLAACGLNLIPLQYRGKRPALKSWEAYQTTRTTPMELEQWTQDPTNLAIICGAISEVVVVDLDSPDALQWAIHNLPETPVRTLTGPKGSCRGEHWFYRHPGVNVPNKARLKTPGSTRKLEVDVRGDGGYVVAPGSVHESGHTYEPLGEWTWDTFQDLPVFDPQWIATKEEAPKRNTLPPPSGVIYEHSSEDLRKRIFAYVDNAPGAPKGSRNTATCEMARHIWDKVGPHEVGWEALWRWNTKATPEPLGEKELRQTYESALRRPQNPGGDWLREAPKAPIQKPLERGTQARPLPAVPPPQKATEELPEAVTGPDGHTLTDTGNAQRFVERFGKDVRYIPNWKTWIIWEGDKWGPPPDEPTGDLTIKLMSQELLQDILTTHHNNKMFKVHLLDSLDSNRINAMKTCAEFQKGITLSSNHLDQRSFLLNCKNGTLDLLTGALRAPRREDLLMKTTGIEFNQEATCQTWEDFILDIMGGDYEMASYLRRVFGYCLTGETKEQCFFFCHGEGSNGKSTMVDLFSTLMGSYSKTSAFTTFIETNVDHSGPRTDIAYLVGSRFVSAAEPKNGKALDMALLKTLTGGEPVTTRFLYSREFEFKPVCKIFLSANKRPPIKDDSYGTWRRIHLIPFLQSFKKKEDMDGKSRLVDQNLPGKLLAELPGILNWAIRGCLEWQKNGLQPPKVVLEASQAYQDEMDPVGQFISDKCIKGPGQVCSAAELYKSFQEWCSLSGERVWTRRTFTQGVERRNVTSYRREDGMAWIGINLKSSPGSSTERLLNNMY